MALSGSRTIAAMGADWRCYSCAGLGRHPECHPELGQEGERALCDLVPYKLMVQGHA